ncbi:hypothetical protein KUCAC02_012061 [Chaenocephalus aceratus]|uniref:Uncharacterized protein n=1 Tax=Chaenocephalus aceratus TaxID=36190 RepID=A0ACB9XAS0_CHAAC|nr:hypothetical protein KUCAC02_012061 [Chaenocephalus aceratus]
MGFEEPQEEVGWKCALFSPHSSLFDTVIMDLFWTHCDDPFKRRPSPPSLYSFSGSISGRPQGRSEDFKHRRAESTRRRTNRWPLALFHNLVDIPHYKRLRPVDINRAILAAAETVQEEALH